MFFADRMILDRARRNADGYMAIHARAARTGIYQYLGREVDPGGRHFAADQVVNVYRPSDEVFDKQSLASFVGKPITNDHPAEAVTSTNWRDLARGTIMGTARDGEFVGFDLAFLDAETIDAVDGGKRELSNGYSCDLKIEDGTAPDGTAYQAVQRNIRGNHVAVVDAGRAGSECRITDAPECAVLPSDEVRKILADQRTYDDDRDHAKLGLTNSQIGDRQVQLKTIMVDGLQVETTDAGEAAIKKLQGDLDGVRAERDKALTDVATLTTDKGTLAAEKVTLETQLADAKAANSPDKLRAAAKELATIADKAKALGVTVTDEMDEAAIRKAAVTAKLGDKCAEFTEGEFAASFATLTADIKPGERKPDALADGIARGIRPVGGKTEISDARRAALAHKETAYLGESAE